MLRRGKEVLPPNVTVWTNQRSNQGVLGVKEKSDPWTEQDFPCFPERSGVETTGEEPSQSGTISSGLLLSLNAVC